jgi:hypothetical protein
MGASCPRLIAMSPEAGVLGALEAALADGTPRTCRDDKAMAIEAAEQLKRKYPHSVVTVENLQTSERTVVEYKPDLGRL